VAARWASQCLIRCHLSRREFTTLLIQRRSQRRTHIRRHPRRSTRRTRAISTIAPPATYNPIDRHIPACQRFEEAIVYLHVLRRCYAFLVVLFSRHFNPSFFQRCVAISVDACGHTHDLDLYLRVLLTGREYDTHEFTTTFTR